jgi:hypothetical protein
MICHLSGGLPSLGNRVASAEEVGVAGDCKAMGEGN